MAFFRTPHLLGLAGMAILAGCGMETPPPTSEQGGDGSAVTVAPSEEAFGDAELIARGEMIAGSLCSTCHAVDRTGESPHRDAIPFRQISWKYPVEMLAEPLAEGIVVGHPDMPQWAFDPYDIEALLAYIESIQEPRST